MNEEHDKTSSFVDIQEAVRIASLQGISQDRSNICGGCNQSMSAVAYFEHECVSENLRKTAPVSVSLPAVKAVPAPIVVEDEHAIEQCTPKCFEGQPELIVPAKVEQEPRNKPGRPKGFNGTHAKMPSRMAQRFKAAGLEWQTDFALAIKAADDMKASSAERIRARDRIKLWLKLLPYLITTNSRSSVRRWKGRPSKAALIALEVLEGRNE